MKTVLIGDLIKRILMVGHIVHGMVVIIIRVNVKVV